MRTGILAAAVLALTLAPPPAVAQPHGVGPGERAAAAQRLYRDQQAERADTPQARLHQRQRQEQRALGRALERRAPAAAAGALARQQSRFAGERDAAALPPRLLQRPVPHTLVPPPAPPPPGSYFR
jgi:hypothetical protein